MDFKRSITAFSLLVLALTTISAQIPVIDSTLSRLQNHIGQTPQEKVYIRTNKEIFTPGETVWFTAYVLDAYSHTPSQISKLLYVDLINPGDTIISTLALKVNEGIAFGDFHWADSLQMGDYVIRAYTRYMKNFDEEFLFNRPVRLVGFSGQSIVYQSDEPKINLQFFPEGGNLIANKLNIVAFKATDDYGISTPITGTIVDDEGNEATSFKTDIFGMGRFQLTPKKGVKYFAEIEGQKKRSELPEAANKGYILNLRETPTKLFLTVKPPNLLSMENSFVIAHSRGEVFLTLPVTAGKPYIYASLPLDQLPTGICHFTFFDGRGFPQAERLFFNYGPFSDVFTEVQSKNATSGTREKVKFDLRVAGIGQYNMDGNVSISILSNSQYGSNKLNIEQFLNLTSDLVGDIEHPEVYFNTANADRKKHMDLLMMTQGWRRFNWNKVVEKQLPPINYYPETGFSIEGKVVKYLNRGKGVQSKVTLSFLENIEAAQEANSEKDGTFWFDGLQIEDTLTAILRTNRLKEGSKGDLVNAKGGTFIKVDKPTIPKVDRQFPNYFESIGFTQEEKVEETVNEEKLEEIAQSNLKIRNIEAQFDEDVIILDEIEVEGRKDQRADPFFRESMTYTKPDSRIVLDSLPGTRGYTNIYELLRGKAPGVEVRGLNPGPYQIIIRGFSTILGNNAALVLVDGAPASPAFVAGINPERVEFVDVLRGAAATLYGARGNGVVAIYLKEDMSLATTTPDPVGFLSFQMTGYYPSRTFYVPQYEEMTDEEKIKPDYRSTLYWNPSVEIKKGKGSFEFYTSDEKSDYTIYIEGITSDGRSILKSAPLEVK